MTVQVVVGVLWAGDSWDPGIACGECGECARDWLVLLAGGAEVGAEGEELLGAGDRAPAAGDLLLQLDHPDVALGEVVVERDAEVVREAQHVLVVAV